MNDDHEDIEYDEDYFDPWDWLPPYARQYLSPGEASWVEAADRPGDLYQLPFTTLSELLRELVVLRIAVGDRVVEDFETEPEGPFSRLRRKVRRNLRRL